MKFYAKLKKVFPRETTAKYGTHKSFLRGRRSRRSVTIFSPSPALFSAAIICFPCLVSLCDKRNRSRKAEERKKVFLNIIEFLGRPSRWLQSRAGFFFLRHGSRRVKVQTRGQGKLCAKQKKAFHVHDTHGEGKLFRRVTSVIVCAWSNICLVKGEGELTRT